MELKYRKHNPGDRLLKAMCRRRVVRQCLIRTAEIHGRYWPDSALGVMAAEDGLFDRDPRLTFVRVCHDDNIGCIRDKR